MKRFLMIYTLRGLRCTEVVTAESWWHASREFLRTHTAVISVTTKDLG